MVVGEAVRLPFVVGGLNYGHSKSRQFQQMNLLLGEALILKCKYYPEQAVNSNR
jgi:hypothetical protein